MKFTAIFLMVLLPVVAWTQIEMGVRGGVAFSRQKFDNFCHTPCTSHHIVGIDAGVMLNWFFRPRFYLQPELSFVQKGGVYNDINGTNKINQLEIATLYGYAWKCEQLSVFVTTGLFLDRILNTPKNEGPYTTAYPQNGVEDNKWGWGLIHGGGAAIPVGNGWIGLEGRYRYSQIESRYVYGFSINGERTPDPILNYKNKGWSISLTYKIGIQ